MIFSIEIKEQAVEDLKAAYDYYEEKKMNLGSTFLDKVDDCLRRIKNNPLQCQIKRAPYRETLVRNFPYLIIYEVINNQIIVYAVFNTWRNPELKPKK